MTCICEETLKSIKNDKGRLIFEKWNAVFEKS